ATGCDSTPARLAPACGVLWGVWPRAGASGRMSLRLADNLATLEAAGRRNLDVVLRSQRWGQPRFGAPDAALGDAGHRRLAGREVDDADQESALWPGADVVDWIAYRPIEDSACAGTPERSPAQTFAPWYDWITGRPWAAGKPIALAAYASAGGPSADRGAWY